MARPAKSVQKLQQYSLRITANMRAEAKHAGRKMDMEDADAFRLAAEVGFVFLRLAEYDLAGSIMDRVAEIAAARRKKRG